MFPFQTCAHLSHAEVPHTVLPVVLSSTSKVWTSLLPVHIQRDCRFTKIFELPEWYLPNKAILLFRSQVSLFPSFPLFPFLLLLSHLPSLLHLFPSPSSLPFSLLPPSLPPFLPSFLPSSHDSSGACNYVCMELCSPGHFINLLCIMFTSPLVGGDIVVMSAVVGGALW